MSLPIGERLRQIRKAKGMTQAQLAKEIGVAQSTIAEIERGMSRSANAQNLLRIAAVLETNPEWLLTGKGSPDISAFTPTDSEITRIADSLTPQAKAAWIAAGLAMIQTIK